MLSHSIKANNNPTLNSTQLDEKKLSCRTSGRSKLDKISNIELKPYSMTNPEKLSGMRKNSKNHNHKLLYKALNSEIDKLDNFRSELENIKVELDKFNSSIESGAQEWDFCSDNEEEAEPMKTQLMAVSQYLVDNKISAESEADVYKKRCENLVNELDQYEKQEYEKQEENDQNYNLGSMLLNWLTVDYTVSSDDIHKTIDFNRSAFVRKWRQMQLDDLRLLAKQEINPPENKGALSAELLNDYVNV